MAAFALSLSPKAAMMQAMIFAAGLGTRLKPLTDTMPKALVPVAGEPLLKHVLFKLKSSGVERFVINVHHFANQITDYLKKNDNFGLDIYISDERQQLLETGGGLRHAARFFIPHSPILIHNVDILTTTSLPHLYRQMTDGSQSSLSCDALLLVSERKTSRYLLFNDDMRLVGWTNVSTGEVRTPYPDLVPEACHRYAFSGLHVFSPSLFPRMEAYGERFPIIDFYLQECVSAHIKGVVDNEMHLLDVGKLDTLAEAERFIKLWETPHRTTTSI